MNKEKHVAVTVKIIDGNSSAEYSDFEAYTSQVPSAAQKAFAHILGSLNELYPATPPASEGKSAKTDVYHDPDSYYYFPEKGAWFKFASLACGVATADGTCINRMPCATHAKPAASEGESASEKLTARPTCCGPSFAHLLKDKPLNVTEADNVPCRNSRYPDCKGCGKIILGKSIYEADSVTRMNAGLYCFCEKPQPASIFTENASAPVTDEVAAAAYAYAKFSADNLYSASAPVTDTVHIWRSPVDDATKKTILNGIAAGLAGTYDYIKPSAESLTAIEGLRMCFTNLEATIEAMNGDGRLKSLAKTYLELAGMCAIKAASRG